MMEAKTKGQATKHIIVGSITAVYGVQGWVKVYSHTRPIENILNYSCWHINRNGRTEAVEIDQGRRHGKGLIAHIVGCDHRELARSYCNSDIMISAGQLPAADEDEIYWHQLEGLTVYSRTQAGDNVVLGSVSHLMATGANDVLVISPSKGSVDKRERLVPWLLDQVVLEVSPEKGFIRVLWDPTF
ncbi:MAG: ribosome maturation factor RimM [Endozoicomonas sp. (ex Botrylloides leachii)]|nr:ribosome maturation factor RimM [Endozoicomonas sp. (ex Botrylloides leachii)]